MRGEIFEVPALLGEDVNRFPGILVVEVIDGQAFDEFGERIEVVSEDGVIKGHGELSGRSYYLSNGVDVNAGDWPWR